MNNYTIAQVKSICEASELPLGIPFIDERLDEYKEKYAGAYPYYPAFRDITQALQPSVVLEIGTWQGTSAACFAAGSENCMVMTIDHHSDPGDEANKVRTLEAVEMYGNIVYLQGCSTEEVTAQKQGTKCVLPDVKRLLSGRTIDILWVDGWHDGQYAKADYDTYVPLMTDGGLIICDDLTGGDSSGHIGMLKFFNDLPGLPEDRFIDGRIHAGYPMGFIKYRKESNGL